MILYNVFLYLVTSNILSVKQKKWLILENMFTDAKLIQSVQKNK